MMFDTEEHTPGPPEHKSPPGDLRGGVTLRVEQFEKRQNQLWVLTFLLLFVLTVFFAWTSWDSMRQLAHRFKALPIGLVVLVVLFGVYTWRRTREISELRGLVRGIGHRDAAPPSEQQLDHLFGLISRSQQGYRDLIDSFDNVLLALSLEGEIRAANRSFAELVDRPFQELIGRPLQEFVEDPDEEYRRAVERGLPRFVERRLWQGTVRVRLKGRPGVRYFECVAHAMTRADRVHGVTVLARDVTLQRESEARFTELFESLQEGIFISTPEGKILDANPALMRMLGYESKEELLARHMDEVFAGQEERLRIQAEIEKQPTLRGQEVVLRRKDGSLITCLNTVAAVRDASGRALRFQGTLLDVTERREMERQLHQQQEFARRLVASFPDMVLVLDPTAHYTFIGPSIKEVLGFEADEDPGMELGERTNPEDRPGLRALFDEIVSGQKTFGSLEIRVRHKAGDWRRILCHFSPLFDEAGKIEGVVISGRDVTQLKRLEEQLIQAEKLAAMGQMLAGVAHELNNPLTAVLGVTELLRERAGTDEATKRQLELTHRQARRAARIVQNLLEFSRPAAPQKKPLDLNAIIDRTLQLQEHSLRRNNVAVDFRGDAGLPPVLGDANQLIQVFLNLISNAEHAIREVRDSGRIQIRLARTGEKILVVVQDDGVGIRPEALPKLFDPFYTTKRPAGGTGLGLSICLSIIREHGGTIEAEVLPGGGSAFTVHFPVAQEVSMASPFDTQVQSRESLQRAADFLKGRSVLVVDDEEGIQLLLKEGLVAHGLRVDCVSTGGQALALLGKQEYDAVLCDLNLPGSPSGREIAERIRSSATRGKPAVLLMTGDLASAAPDGSDLEPKRWLQKPFRIAEVISALAEALLSADAETIRK